MNNSDLFNSKTDPIPSLRRGLQIIPIRQNGDQYLYFHDDQGYVTPNLALNRQIGTLLSLIDGQKSIHDLEPYLANEVHLDQLLEFIQFLDKNRLLASSYFREYAEEIEAQYEEATLHSSVAAGSSYPEEPEELRAFLDDAFAKYEQPDAPSQNIKALYAPHIDPRVGIDSYVKAFAPTKNFKPKRVVVLATSHYAGLFPEYYQDDPFIVVDKDFKLPLGTIRRDEEAITKLLNSEDIGVTNHDRAHRSEHSIELHLLFLSYLWNHDFTIVPILTRGLDDLYYMEDGHLGRQLKNFSALLQTQFGQDDETFFLISGDLAHFGKKFGDEFAASTIFDEVKSFDEQFLAFGSENQPLQMLDLMRQEMDPYRICGFPPLYTFLQSMPNVRGKVLSYDLWNEEERESAVSFGSILYTHDNQ